MNILKQILYAGLNIVFPSKCPICDNNIVKYPSIICKHCKEKLDKQIFPIYSFSKNINKIISCTNYTEMAKKCIHTIKYQKIKQIIYTFKDIIKKIIENTLINEKIDIIIPIPMHKKQYIKREFNQSEIIAKIISKEFNIPILTKNLIKIKHTPSQTQLNKTKRKTNLNNVFIIKNQKQLIGKNILLVDDIITTGTTIDTCAKILLKANIKNILGFTLAKTI